MTEHRSTEKRNFVRGDAVWWHSGGNAAHPAGRIAAEVVRYSTSGKRVYIRYASPSGIPWHVFVAPGKLEVRS